MAERSKSERCDAFLAGLLGTLAVIAAGRRRC
jgi:hypothetical protein